MANRERGEVDLSIGGQVYTLILNTNAIASLEAVLSTVDKEVALPEVLYTMARGSHRYTRAFVWACLRQHHKAVTMDQTGDLIDAAGGVDTLFESLASLRKSALPDAEDAATLAKPAARPQTPRRPRGTGAAATSMRDGSDSAATPSGR